MYRLTQLLDRYSEAQREVILQFLHKLAQATRKTGRITESAQAKIAASFAAYDVDVVIASLEIYLAMDISQARSGKGKNEKYVCGIMANKQADKDGAGDERDKIFGGKGTGNSAAGQGSPAKSDEGARLTQLAESNTGGQLDCDF